MLETQVRSLGQEDPLEKGMQPIPLLLPREFHGQRSLAGYSPWGRKELDTTEQLTHTCTHTHTHPHTHYNICNSEALQGLPGGGSGVFLQQWYSFDCWASLLNASQHEYTFASHYMMEQLKTESKCCSLKIIFSNHWMCVLFLCEC